MEAGGSLLFLRSPPLVRILSQIIPVHALPPYFFKIHFNVIFPTTPRSSKPCLHIPHFLLAHSYYTQHASLLAEPNSTRGLCSIK